MAEKSPSLATQAYRDDQRKYSESYLSSGHGSHRSHAHQRTGDEPQPGPYCDPDAAGRRADRF